MEIKGGLVPARFTMVFITSNYTPDKWYKNEDGARDEEMKALARRLDIGDPTRIPPRPDGPRYIHVDSRDALHRRIDMLKWSGILPGAAAAAAPPRSDEPLPACPLRMQDPPTDEEEECAAAATADEEPPRLRRAVAHITVADATQDADMVTTADGEHFVRDDLIAQHSPSWFAPQP